MKLKIENGKLGIVLGLALLAGFTAMADSPTYLSAGPTANTTNATLILPAVANNQFRIVWLQGSSDKAASKFSLQTGAGAYAVGTNSPAGTTINVTTTNGLAANDPVVIQSADGRWITNCTISSFAWTNLTLSITPAFGFTNGDSVYKMSATNTINIGAVTNKVYTGEAIYVGRPGRPVLIGVDGTAYGTVDLVTYRQE